ncbi:uncharacterized protein PGTG_10599 [Puccinia graminis f. sp. tritici CRL 75-36-700-3]|uniref:Uncharacterized protein n=1 Tax=Puccinia graminis f. sp. tritici (strain CRL 75-36-700-3 / race SCCL) TaxID=418459 RepID=E3KIU6_PUCGT|nr:uncharacterized protein PGTG_10599 [Puccinia graminis f. sp. tritici CRL 75-36-700-3]EFP84221.2 hypothetical protein PGTG_10599 [Puccinia graminis f. sp. tritici CRL 75-36-700-3]
MTKMGSNHPQIRGPEGLRSAIHAVYAGDGFGLSRVYYDCRGWRRQQDEAVLYAIELSKSGTIAQHPSSSYPTTTAGNGSLDAVSASGDAMYSGAFCLLVICYWLRRYQIVSRLPASFCLGWDPSTTYRSPMSSYFEIPERLVGQPLSPYSLASDDSTMPDEETTAPLESNPAIKVEEAESPAPDSPVDTRRRVEDHVVELLKLMSEELGGDKY